MAATEGTFPAPALEAGGPFILSHPGLLSRGPPPSLVLSSCLSVPFCVSRSFILSLFLFGCLCLSVCLSLCVSQSLHLFVSPSLCVPVSPDLFLSPVDSVLSPPRGLVSSLPLTMEYLPSSPSAASSSSSLLGEVLFPKQQTPWGTRGCQLCVLPVTFPLHEGKACSHIVSWLISHAPPALVQLLYPFPKWGLGGPWRRGHIPGVLTSLRPSEGHWG